MTAARRVVVTGVGAVAPGVPGAVGAELLWRNLLSGVSAVGPISRFDASGFPTRFAAEVHGLEEEAASLPSDFADRSRIGQMAALALREAVEASGLPENSATRAETGLVLAAGMGTYGHGEVFAAAGEGITQGVFDAVRFTSTLRSALRPLAAERQSPGSLAPRLARLYGLKGPVLAVMTACSAGTQAIGDALSWIREGRADVVLAGGSDSEIYPMGLASFSLLGALSTRNEEPKRASRPFDASRDGFVLGEGAAFLVLEERERALRRGASPLAEVAGFGSACDAFRVTDPHPQGDGAVLAMTKALSDAGLDPSEIGWVNAHGTSTPANDRVEATALARVFGERLPRLPVSSTKSMIGHLTVAAGAVEAVATVLALRDAAIHPTLNQETPDPECPLDTVAEGARHVALEAAISNSFAFGGQTACLAFRRAGM